MSGKKEYILSEAEKEAEKYRKIRVGMKNLLKSDHNSQMGWGWRREMKYGIRLYKTNYIDFFSSLKKRPQNLFLGLISQSDICTVRGPYIFNLELRT